MNELLKLPRPHSPGRLAPRRWDAFQAARVGQGTCREAM